MSVDYPYRIDGRGRTARTDGDEHVRDLIEQLLFTVPGERVNRPDFGCGLLQLVFAPNSPELAAATQFTVAAALQQWLGEIITVDAVTVESIDAELRITIRYIVNRSGETRIAQFARGGGA